MARFWGQLVGCVRLRVTGAVPERLINLCAAEQIPLWDVRRREDGIDVTLPLPYFFQLRPLLRKSRCRARVVGRRGLPFLWRRLRRRRTLLWAGVAVVVGLYAFSSFIWFFEVRGNERLTDQEILAEAARAGLRPGAWRLGLNQDVIARDMILGLPGLAWVRIEFLGTKAVIEVVERTLPPELEASGPGDLVAERAGLVEEVLVFQGEPQVQPGDAVVQGQILIRGLIGAPGPAEQFPAPGEELPPERFQPVRARGRVIARTWRTGYLELPLERRLPIQTGRQVVRYALAIGERHLILSGPRDLPFEHFKLQRRAFPLPPWSDGETAFRLVVDRYQEVQYVPLRRTRQEALDEARRRLRAALLDDVEPDARIEAVDVDVVRASDSAVAIRMVVEVLEDIARFQPAAAEDHGAPPPEPESPGAPTSFRSALRPPRTAILREARK